MNDLSHEAKEIIHHMVEHCVNHGYCMGQDEGLGENGQPTELRAELEDFLALPHEKQIREKYNCTPAERLEAMAHNLQYSHLFTEWSWQIKSYLEHCEDEKTTLKYIKRLEKILTTDFCDHQIP